MQQPQAFASISALLDKVIREDVHNQGKTKNSLYLVASSSEPIHFFDISKTKLSFPQDDLEAYLNSNPQIALGSTVCLENCEITYESSKDNQIVSCEIQSKSIVIEAGTAEEKKLKSCKIRLQVQTDSGEIPLLPSTRRFLRRLQKQQIARKELKKTNKNEITPAALNAFLSYKGNAPSDASKKQSNLFSQQIGAIDSESVKILQKLVHFVDKDELFNLLATKPLKTKASKKAVRLMVIPNAKQIKGDPLAFRKKNYMREEVEQLCRHYENMEIDAK